MVVANSSSGSHMDRAEPAELRIWLEWAGGKLLAMRLASGAPAEYRSFWPDYADDYASAYGYTAETLRAPRVLPNEVAIMEAILRLPSLAREERVRRILHRRALVAPVSGHYIHSYTKIARELHLDARLVARLYNKGLAELAKRTPRRQAHAIRHFLSSYPLMRLTPPPDAV